MEATVANLESQLQKFLKKGERMLICFPDPQPGTVGMLLSDAVRRVGGFPEIWGPDFRWKELLRLIFSKRIKSIAGPPRIILGLSKLVRAAGTPLPVRNVLLVGCPSADWMNEGIELGLDCRIWRSTIPPDGLMCGLSCNYILGADPELIGLEESLLSWTSILDCKLEKGEYGLEMEIVAFSGEKLPSLPSCAKRIIRPWDPDRDEPFCVAGNGRIPLWNP